MTFWLLKLQISKLKTVYRMFEHFHKRKLSLDFITKKYDLKGSERLCKVVELSMQCCGKLLTESFET